MKSKNKRLPSFNTAILNLVLLATFSINVFAHAGDEPDPPIWLRNFQNDVAGNSVAVVVLIAMIIAVIYTGVIFMRGEALKPWSAWITPILVIIGLGVAAYLSVNEIIGGEVICSPGFDCPAVQNSPYARLFGVLYVGVLGMIGYVLIGAAWAVGRWAKEAWRSTANMAAFSFSVFGALFSIYLTFLEPFVIGATCMWCISSAIIITLLMLNTTPTALNSWMLLDEDDFEGEEDAD